MNVLLVDDDRFVIAALQKGIAWESLGFTEVFTAGEINSAKEIINSNKIDLLLSDIDMPMAQGWIFLAFCVSMGTRFQLYF